MFALVVRMTRGEAACNLTCACGGVGHYHPSESSDQVHEQVGFSAFTLHFSSFSWSFGFSFLYASVSKSHSEAKADFNVR